LSDDPRQVPAALPGPFYRVALKAIIFDDQQRMLIVFNDEGNPEVPGGGWEHDETFEECLRREVREELGVELTSISPIEFTYRGVNVYGWHALRIVVRAELVSHDFKLGDDMSDVRFVTKEELLDLDYVDPSDAAVKDCVDLIWPKP
jgi:8-oxo-dGTP diphosphatase